MAGYRERLQDFALYERSHVEAHHDLASAWRRHRELRLLWGDWSSSDLEEAPSQEVLLLHLSLSDRCTSALLTLLALSTAGPNVGFLSLTKHRPFSDDRVQPLLSGHSAWRLEVPHRVDLSHLLARS